MSPLRGSRREFLKAVAAAGAVLQGCAEPAVSATAVEIPTAVLGKTGLTVPRVCLGAGALRDHNAAIMREALARGITMIDTAYGYGNGNSEAIVGKALKNVPRERVVLQTKVTSVGRISDKSDAEVEKLMTRNLETSLKRLGTDYVDILLYPQGAMHAEDVDFPQLRRCVERLKQSGRIRFFGCSTHQEQTAPTEAAIDSGWHDVIMTVLHMASLEAPIREVMAAEIEVLNAAHAAESPQRRQPKSIPPDLSSLVAKIQASGIGVIGMKGAAYLMEIPRAVEAVQARYPEAARTHSPHQLCYRWLYDHPCCHTVCVGMATLRHLEEALALPAIQLA